jgi:hypothetical protein
MRTLTCLLGFMAVAGAIAQGPMRNWRFGWTTALDMETGPPTFQDGSAMFANESSVSVSDQAGDLLFYSEGVQVYNANDAVMPNGTGLLSNSYDFQQGVATCPLPGDPNKHLLFHTGFDQVLRVSTVDMSLDGGLGAVTDKNIVIAANIAEAMTIAPHTNGTDYWLVVRDFPADLFKVFAITSAGVGPMVSSAACGMDTFDWTGMARFNHAFDRLAVTMRGGFGNMGKVGLFPFDPSTGVLGAGTLVPSLDPWGLEFSCSDRYLYLSHNGFVPIEQFNMFAGSPAQILASAVDVSEPVVTFDLAYAPDNRIYFTWNDPLNTGARALGAIRQPDEQGALCDVTYTAVVWNDSTAIALTGLPNFIQSSAPSNGSCAPLATSIPELISNGPSLSSTVVQEGTWVHWSTPTSGYEISVFHAAGGLVQRIRVQGEAHWLNTSALSQGLYVLHVNSVENDIRGVLKFVKE